MALDWKPIDTAPKDRKLLLWGRYWSDSQGWFTDPMIGMWNARTERWECDGRYWFGVRPTHYVLLTPPSEQPTICTESGTDTGSNE